MLNEMEYQENEQMKNHQEEIKGIVESYNIIEEKRDNQKKFREVNFFLSQSKLPFYDSYIEYDISFAPFWSRIAPCFLLL